jgi:hypothetical protein
MADAASPVGLPSQENPPYLIGSLQAPKITGLRLPDPFTESHKYLHRCRETHRLYGGNRNPRMGGIDSLNGERPRCGRRIAHLARLPDDHEQEGDHKCGIEQPLEGQDRPHCRAPFWFVGSAPFGPCATISA